MKTLILYKSDFNTEREWIDSIIEPLGLRTRYLKDCPEKVFLTVSKIVYEDKKSGEEIEKT